MATIDELLDSASALDDIDEVILVDPVKRELLIPSTEFILGVECDKSCECKYFKIARNIGNGIDVSVCDIKILFETPAGVEKYAPAKEVVSDDNSVVFCWEVSEEVVETRGDVKFSICVCHDNDKDKEWHTTFTIGKVLPGLKCGVTSSTTGGTTGGDTDTSDATATSSDILYGKVAYANGAKVVGTMRDNGAVSGDISSNGIYRIQEGYHNGQGAININVLGGGAITAAGDGDAIVITTSATTSAVGDDIIIGG